MVKDRKPMFVSAEALKVLKQKATDQKCFVGDVVDMLLGIRTMEEIDEQFKTNILKSKMVGRLPKLGRKHGTGEGHAGVPSGELESGGEGLGAQNQEGQGDGPGVPSFEEVGKSDHGQGLRFVLY